MPQMGNRHSQHSFAQIPDVTIGRSMFNRSHAAKDTMEFDYLTPILVEEILPGDTMNLTLNAFARLTSVAIKNPVMDNMYIDFFAFFVPARLVWDNWERFNGAQDDPTSSTDYVLPSMTIAAGFGEGTIYDHMGLPINVTNIKINNTLPLRANNLIWNEWFRDQNTMDSLDVPKDDGPDVAADFNVWKRAKRHDYFTSCLPWPQKGPAVELPLGGFAAVIAPTTSTNIGVRINSVDRTLAGGSSSTNQIHYTGAQAPSSSPLYWGSNTGLQADLSSATAVTINELREAFAMQALFELDARGGTRYTEILLNHFNVTSPDFRLQRPEYLGGGQIDMNSNPVAATAEGTNTKVGELGGFGTASTRGANIGFTKSFVEHGYVIMYASPRADITYQQGMNRMWNRSTRYDFFWPKLSQIGEQAVLNKEIYTQGTTVDEEVFGYQERYAEYRYKPSEIRGQFRSTFAQSLDNWHLAEEFGVKPSLNAFFMTQNTPIDRVVADTNVPPILMDMWFDIKHARPMPTYSVPASLGRF